MDTRGLPHGRGILTPMQRSYPQAASYFRHKKLLANVDNLGVRNSCIRPTAEQTGRRADLFTAKQGVKGTSRYSFFVDNPFIVAF